LRSRSSFWSVSAGLSAAGVVVSNACSISDLGLLVARHPTTHKCIERVFSNSEYIVTFFDIIYGECMGEGTQAVAGKLRIESKTEFNLIHFKGSDAYFSSKKCQEIGSG
jgi:spermidine synthase